MLHRPPTGQTAVVARRGDRRLPYPSVDLELVLAVDVPGSIDAEEAALL